jgi:hypothetical protein
MVSPGLGYTQSSMTLGPSGIKTIVNHLYGRGLRNRNGNWFSKCFGVKPTSASTASIGLTAIPSRLNLRDQWVEMDAAAVIEKNNFNVARQ